GGTKDVERSWQAKYFNLTGQKATPLREAPGFQTRDLKFEILIDCGRTVFGPGSGQGQFQGERGALARAVALAGECSAQLFCRQSAAVQPETVAVLAGGEAMGENLFHVVRMN